MEITKLEQNRFFLRLSKGEKLFESLNNFIVDSKFNFISVDNAIGMSINNEINQFDINKNQYVCELIEEELEVISINGNVSFNKDKKPVTHLHGVFSKFDTSVVGGHISEIEVLITLEVFITCYENINLHREESNTFKNVKLLKTSK